MPTFKSIINLDRKELKFRDLISREYARQALLECNEIAEQEGFSKMTLDEINAEINNAKNNHR
jgi:hypothetical protein